MLSYFKIMHIKTTAIGLFGFSKMYVAGRPNCAISH